MNVALQVIAFDEPGLSDTLDAWAAQSVPHGLDVSYEAWITPTAKGETWHQAESHPVFEPFETPKYKLPSRNRAHTDAVGRGVDAFIAADADAPPLDSNVLSVLTERLSASGVAAVMSNPVSPPHITGTYSNFKAYIREHVLRSIHGQCSGITAGAWRHAGPFNEDIDHTKLHPVWMEEEYRFARRLREYGTVEPVYEARVYNDTRRIDCRWTRDNGPFCERMAGDETFAPR